MPQTPDQVIEATLKAAAIRASATAWGRSTDFTENEIAQNIVGLAKAIYREATRGKWQRGDDGEGTPGIAGGPIVLTPSGGVVAGVPAGAGGTAFGIAGPSTVQVQTT